MPTAEEVGRRIYHARREMDMTQRQLALRVGVSERTINRWERGWNGPRGVYLTRLAHALKLSVADLLEELVA